MDFEQNAVESDYDEDYDSKTVVMSRGQARVISNQDEEEQLVPKIKQKIEILDYKLPQEKVRRLGPVQLPRVIPAEETQPINLEKPNEFNFPKGGWNVQKIERVPIADLTRVNAVLSTKGATITAQRSPQRVFRWRNITNEILNADVTAPEQEFEEVKPKTRSPKVEEIRVIPEENDRRKNTKFCRFVEIKNVNGKTVEVNKCRSSTCSYAHTIEAYNPPTCRFQDGCRNMATCAFKHKSETKESYHERSSRLQRPQKP